MNTQSTAIEKNAADMSVKELQDLLSRKKSEESAALAKKRKKYEDRREEIINTLGGFAVSLQGQMKDLKLEAFMELTQFRMEMLEYGDLRRGEQNKGSFEIKNDKFKIVFSNQVNKRFDERAELAEAKLREFMESFVRNRDKKVYKLVKSLLERNPKTGDYDVDLINRLYTMEDTFDDHNWKEALRLFKESYSPCSTAQYVRFFAKNPTNNSWDAIVLDFAKLNTKGDQEEETSEAA